MSKHTGRLARLAWFIGVSLAAFLALTCLAYRLGINAEGIHRAADTLDALRYLLMAARLTLIGAVWYWWQPLVNWLYPPSIPAWEEKRALAYRQRNKFALFFIAVEILLVQNLLGNLMGVLF